MATKVCTDVGCSTGIPNSSAFHPRPDKPQVAGAIPPALDRGDPSIDVLKLWKGHGQDQKYKHVYAIHLRPRTSCLSHEAVEVPSFLGFRNLMVIVLSECAPSPPASSCSKYVTDTFYTVVGNLRLVIENYLKVGYPPLVTSAFVSAHLCLQYGFIISLQHDIRADDIRLGALLYILIPAQLFLAFLIELVAVSQARLVQSRPKKDEEPPTLRVSWVLILCAHWANATSSLLVASYVAYNMIHHPVVGTLCVFHAGRASSGIMRTL